MIDFLRQLKYLLAEISSFKIFGFHIDFFLHFFIGGLLFYILQRKYSAKTSLIFTLAFMVLKEIVDLFLKSRLEYVRPPGLDVLGDFLSGLAGIGLVTFLKYYKLTNHPHSLLEQIEINLALALNRLWKHAFSSILLILVITMLLAAFLSTYAILFGTRKFLAETIHPFQVNSMTEKDRQPMTTNNCKELIEHFKTAIDKVSFNLAGYLPVEICLDSCDIHAELIRISEPFFEQPPALAYYGQAIPAESLFYNPEIAILRMNKQNFNRWGYKILNKEITLRLPRYERNITTRISGIYVTESAFIEGYISPFCMLDFHSITISYKAGTSYKIILDMNRYLQSQSYGYEVPLSVISRAQFIQLQIAQFNQLFLFWAGTIILIGIITLSLIFYRMTVRRFGEISIRRVEGALASDILLQFFFDYFILFILGSIFGVVFGFALAFFSQKIAHHEYIKAYLPLSVYFYGIIGTLFSGVLAVVIPSKQAIAVLPAETMRYE